MTIYAVIALTGHQSIDQTVPIAFPQRSFRVGDGHWAVNAAGTSQEVAGRLGIVAGQNQITGLVYSISGYWGIANPQLWEWLTNNWNLPGG